MDLSALQIGYISPGIGQVFFKNLLIFNFSFQGKTQFNSLCSLDDPTVKVSDGTGVFPRPLGRAGEWSVLVLASCSKLITPGYFLTGENVNITPRERRGSPPAAFLFMSFNSINGLLGPWTVVLLLYLYFFSKHCRETLHQREVALRASPSCHLLRTCSAVLCRNEAE